MLSCSSLARYCAFAVQLNKKRPRLPKWEAYAKLTADEGSKFGALVQSYLEGLNPEEPIDFDEIFAQFAEWRDNPLTRQIPRGAAVCEIPLGLGKDGRYVPVVEIYPHFYVPAQDAAGRPYYLPAAGPQEELATAGRLDVGWVNGNVGVVLDMKRSAFKYPDPDTVPQLMALGVMWAMRNDLDWLQVGLYGARDGVYQWAVEIVPVAEVLPEVLRMCALPEDRPTPGPHCGVCWERACPEHPKYTRPKRKTWRKGAKI